MDLDDLVQLAGAGEAAGEGAGEAGGDAAGNDDLMQIVPGGAGGEAAGEAAADDDLMQLVAMAGQPLQERYQQRGHLLLAHARQQKKLRSAQSELASATLELQSARQKLDDVATNHHTIAKFYGIKRTAPPMNEHRAACLLELSGRPAIKSDTGLMLAQSRAAQTVSRAILNTQNDYFMDRFVNHNVDEDGRRAAGKSKIHILDWGWDETGQGIRNVFLRKLLRQERISSGKTTAQIMMQGGSMHEYEFEAGIGTVVSSNPLVARGLALESQVADAILEGVLRGCPLQLASAGAMKAVAAKCDMFIFGICVDRASVNFKIISWIVQQLSRPDFPSNIMLHCEPCVAHGIALVKSRPKSKHLLQGASSFCGLTRVARFAQSLRDELHDIVKRNLRIVRGPMPDDTKANNLKLLEQLFGDLGSDYLHRVRRDGTRVFSTFRADLEVLASSMAFGGPVDDLVHYCWCDEANVENLRKIGDRCCYDFDDAVAKFVVPLLNLVANRPWDRPVESRWTFVLTTLRKWCIGELCGHLLPAAISSLQIKWSATNDLEAVLEKLVAADHGDYHAHSKLRLLRVCKRLCTQSAAGEIAIVIQVLSTADRILYEVFGEGGRGRARIKSLVGEEVSSLGRCQHSLLQMASAWDKQAWPLFDAVSGEFGSEELQHFARRQVLSLGASMVDHFELRMSRPPYTLQKIGDPAVTMDRQEEVATAFMRENFDCLPPSCKSFRKLCGSVHGVLVDAPHFMAGLNCCHIAIDAIERSHGQMRLDLRSSGKAKNFVSSSNRVVCQQAKAFHRARVVGDASVPPPPLPEAGWPDRDTHRPRKKAKQAGRLHFGGNAYLSFRNHRLAVFKNAHAKSRKLTVAELDIFDTETKEKWDQLCPERRASWEQIWRCEVAERATRPNEPLPVADGSGDVSCLWGASGAGDGVVPLATIVGAHKSIGAHERRKLARKDDSVIVPSSCAPRASTSTVDMMAVFGCYNSKRNVCRHVLDDHVVASLNRYTALLDKWVTAMSAETHQACTELLWVRGRGDGDLRRDMAILLVDVRLKPKNQIFARVGFDTLGDGIYHEVFKMPEFPATLKITSGASRISDHFKSIRWATADEIALEMVRAEGIAWDLIPLEWSLEKPCTDLLRMVVSGGGELLDPKAVATKGKKKNTGLDELSAIAELGTANPLEHGIAAGAAQASSSSAKFGAAAPMPPADASGLHELEQQAVDEFIDDVGLDGLPQAFVADVMHDLLGGGEDLGEDDAADLFWDGDDAGGASDASVCEEAALAHEGDGPGHGAGPIPHSIPELIAATEVSPLGYITCKLPPWNAALCLGRITTWPKDKPEANRSVSCKCGVHSGCVSPARRRWQFSNEDFLTWLYSGTFEYGSDVSSERSKELAKMHVAMAKEMLVVKKPAGGAGAPPAPAAPSASGAASSSDVPAPSGGT